ncbi:MAG TPA: NAD-dependent epimerase/dehydratase family protein [Acidimicrobiia bacterium]|nr:NAD-dependent epimerase/dehydratase family protein [Acidimicrobiia bacterium]
MRLLVLGGSGFVGGAVVEAAADRGWSVTTFNRGRGNRHHPDSHRITGDRTSVDDLSRLDGRWDAVVDTWAGAPSVVRDSAEFLADRADRYLLISSRAVYATPTPRDMNESADTVPASPDDPAIAYGRDKRGAEMAVEAAFGDRGVLARAGLILGPGEDLGRLPFWLLRVARGGRVAAPGPPDLPWRFIDVRDLAGWLLHAAREGLSGPFNLVAPDGHATTGSVLQAALEVTGADTELVWADPADIEAAGINRFDAFPGWVPPDAELAGLIWTDVSRAVGAGLACRPARETVTDTWNWVLERGGTAPRHPDHPHDFPPDEERRLIARARQ